MATPKPGIRKTPLSELTPHPRNPRQGDIGAIAESIRRNGFYGTLVAQISTGYVLAGNHRLEAARHLELTRIPVHWVDVDDETAYRILVADNRTTDLATYDDESLADLLREIAVSDSGLLGTGWDGDDLDDLLLDLEAGSSFTPMPDEDVPRLDRMNPITCPECGATFDKPT